LKVRKQSFEFTIAGTPDKSAPALQELELQDKCEQRLDAEGGQPHLLIQLLEGELKEQQLALERIIGGQGLAHRLTDAEVGLITVGVGGTAVPLAPAALGRQLTAQQTLDAASCG